MEGRDCHGVPVGRKKGLRMVGKKVPEPGVCGSETSALTSAGLSKVGASPRDSKRGVKVYTKELCVAEHLRAVESGAGRHPHSGARSSRDAPAESRTVRTVVAGRTGENCEVWDGEWAPASSREAAGVRMLVLGNAARIGGAMDGLDDAPKGGYRAAGVILPRAQQSARRNDRAVRGKATETVREGYKPQSEPQDPASAASGVVLAGLREERRVVTAEFRRIWRQCARR
ncbi:hypothetical protein B0H13DRAFT_1864557 [Mycena leptocephala]|nr:hypothetical protein B0H13DRAFT_1864557 [Mycena leptocephala]